MEPPAVSVPRPRTATPPSPVPTASLIAVMSRLRAALDRLVETERLLERQPFVDQTMETILVHLTT